MRRNSAFLPVAAACLAVLPAALDGQVHRVKDTVHNLSASGPGRVRAASETEVCIFCHTPHGSSGVEPLWNRSLPVGPYQIYQSSSLKAKVGQPTGASKLCLSCHDGTIALGSVLSRPQPIVMAGADRMPPGRTNLGTDLTDDHPISFAYATSLTGGNPDLVAPAAIPPPVSLDKNGEVQCTSCHDAHDDGYGMFLVRANDRSALCTSCHRIPPWPTGAHATSAGPVSGTAAARIAAPATTVADNACGSCHRPHGAPGKPWLLDGPNINSTCQGCHDGTVSARSIKGEIVKLSNHGIDVDSTPGSPGGPYLEGDRVTCGDCHDPHAAGSPENLSPGVPASLARVAGVNLAGASVALLTRPEDLCFRCHGDGPARVPILLTRSITQPNIRLQFQPNNPSFHPVGNPGANPLVPSLLPPLTVASMISCVDCHDADDSRRVGRSGPAGPHGSIYRPLLVRRYDTMDFSVESPAAFDLCYKCHQRDSILRDDSFKEHRKHVADERTPCSACHDPHGIYSGQGTSRKNAHLINFDRSIVFPSRSGRLEYASFGGGHGQCYLTCHGENHDPETY